MDGFATLVFGSLGRRDHALERLEALFDSFKNTPPGAGFYIDAKKLRGDSEKALEAFLGEQNSRSAG
jgi:hypothetical protein